MPGLGELMGLRTFFVEDLLLAGPRRGGMNKYLLIEGLRLKRSIYVSAEEPTVITGLIDWQSTSIEPAFIYANETPDFAALPRVPEEDPLENEQNETEVSGQKERELKDASVCYQTYDVVMTALVHKLRPARLLDPTLFRLFHYCHTTWRDSAVAVRQELIELSARWAELGLEGLCPYSPTEAELKQHARD
ncbi:hypothetical protein PENANT_c027G06816 [Penicillium antarcticum]|uniref:Aminoglycoside phosphotransferase domain-containing protein n=1 Tax=Penicillium antarcticum TaxID=416450 RepID=A0A1V6PX10_9EURO|nr:hypothetical protein PENANT_c027G06816 [Penicillium antarcticum]